MAHMQAALRGGWRNHGEAPVQPRRKIPNQCSFQDSHLWITQPPRLQLISINCRRSLDEEAVRSRTLPVCSFSVNMNQAPLLVLDMSQREEKDASVIKHLIDGCLNVSFNIFSTILIWRSNIIKYDRLKSINYACGVYEREELKTHF